MLFISAKVSAAIIYLDAVLTMVLSGPIHVDLCHKTNINIQTKAKEVNIFRATNKQLHRKPPHTKRENG